MSWLMNVEVNILKLRARNFISEHPFSTVAKRQYSQARTTCRSSGCKRIHLRIVQHGSKNVLNPTVKNSSTIDTKKDPGPFPFRRIIYMRKSIDPREWI